MPLVGVVRVERDTYSRKDGRRKVDRHIVEYMDDGYEYRKTFEVNRGETFNPPQVLVRCLKTFRVTVKKEQ